LKARRLLLCLLLLGAFTPAFELSRSMAGTFDYFVGVSKALSLDDIGSLSKLDAKAAGNFTAPSGKGFFKLFSRGY
jgi:hypothetical protein